MKRKLLCSFISFAVFMFALPLSTTAHNSDYWSGVYTGFITQSNLKFRIESTAITSLLTSSVYHSAYNWSGISSNVGNIGVAIAAPGMPTTGFFSLYGQVLYGGTLGTTIYMDSLGNIVNANSNWHMVCILMNTDSSAYSGTGDPTQDAKKVFIHEVGHTLKLCHPVYSPGTSGHTYNGGYPKAIMNQGLPKSSTPWVSATIAEHDKSNLKAKWGA